MFFAETQNKLLFAVTNNTAAEIVLSRANPQAANMGLMAWKGKVVRKQDIIVAKNYLSLDEIDTLNRLVVIFLESAELRAKKRQDLTIQFWRDNVDKILEFQDQNILKTIGTVSNEQMKTQVKEIYQEFDQRRKTADAQAADKQDLEDMKNLAAQIKNKKKE